MAIANIAIIGAGLAGAACAQALREAGLACVLYDKGRGPGGRLSTRRTETPLGEVSLDHGAQFITARGEAFSGLMRSAAAAGQASVWQGRLVSIDRAGNVEPLRPEERWVGVPGMNAVVKHALEGFDVHFSKRIQRLAGGPGAWMLVLEDGSRQGPFDAVAITIPPEQMVDLLARTDGDFSTQIAQGNGAVIGPCQAVMAVLDAPFDPGFDGAKLYGGALAWMARSLSRPGRSGPESWILHASTSWSAANLEGDPDDVVRNLVEEAHIRFGFPARPAWAAAHRWRYALSERAPGTPFAIDETGTVGCAGDWRLGGRAELAWDSGAALGAALASRFAA
ncbi:MAG: NAD(P)/FAD-dependent oxidoreductase [Caulobacterales bacterium]|uniref:NAD(P)/FAD-dependent oxidoreductase n=1 Tax=Glycocaulis sp. TaxID=1969725 RepID=UPI003FA147F8